MMKIGKSKGKALVVAAALGATALSAQAESTVMKAQGVTLRSGWWNAFSINVTPTNTADQIFEDWPVTAVGYYDPSAFLATKQYSGTASTEGASRTGYVMWRRGSSALSELKYLVPGVYVCFNTNAATESAFTTTLYGRPSAPAVTWHPSSTNDTMNLVGISIESGKKTTLAKYYDGFDGKGTSWKAFKVTGNDPAEMALKAVGGSTEFSDGEALVMTCTKVTDWSGVFSVTPREGIDFGATKSRETLTIKNGSTVARTFRLAIGAGADPALEMPPLGGLLVRDASHFTNTWVQFASDAPFERELAVNETVKLQIAVDRTKFSGTPGTCCAGILTVTDVSQESCFKAELPLEVTNDGGTASAHAWPKGVWLASGSLDTVTFLETVMDGDDVIRTEEDVKAGGKMKVRLPLAVDSNGGMTLLQRFVYGTDADGVTHVYSPNAEDAFPVAIGNVKRVSSAVLPIDEPVIAATSGAFGQTAEFPFTVSENSAVNPYRHVYHPSHDGLTWEFDPDKPTPSGDDLNNYVATVKPEIFSVTNRITFAWDKSTGTVWNPEETLTGNLTWELTGVRHEGAIRMKGTFTMKRISSATIDE